MQNSPVILEGIDVSQCQGPKIDWAVVKSSGREYAYIKSSEGISYKDPCFDRNVPAARDAGLRVGAYHVFRPDGDASKQADAFFKLSGGLGEFRLQMPPCIDFELQGTKTWAQLAQAVIPFIEAVRERFSCDPMLYTYPWFIRQVVSAGNAEANAALASCHLWLASYSKQYFDIKPPEPWSKITIIQYAGNDGRCPGVPTACDLDKFSGDDEALRRLCGDPGPFPQGEETSS